MQGHRTASGYDVERYEKDIERLDATPPPNDAGIKADIAEFLVRRFTERYFTPINAVTDRKKKHGFCTMAVSCLMIETLQCFWTGAKGTQGWDKRKKKN